MMKPFKAWAVVNVVNDYRSIYASREDARHFAKVRNDCFRYKRWKVVRVIVKEARKK